jgi:hypothetical protein
MKKDFLAKSEVNGLTANSPTFAGLEYWNAGMLGLTDEGLFEISVLDKKRHFSALTPL